MKRVLFFCALLSSASFAFAPACRLVRFGAPTPGDNYVTIKSLICITIHLSMSASGCFGLGSVLHQQMGSAVACAVCLFSISNDFGASLSRDFRSVEWARWGSGERFETSKALKSTTSLPVLTVVWSGAFFVCAHCSAFLG